MLRTRLLTAAILAPVVVVAVLLGEPWLSVLIGLVAFLAMAELLALLDAGGFEPPQVIGLFAGVATTAAGLITVNQSLVGGVLSDLLRAAEPAGLLAAVFAAAILLIGVVGFTRADPRNGFVSWSVTTFGVAYIGVLTPAVVLVAHLGPPTGSATTPIGLFGLRSGIAWAATLLLIVWGYDTGAYLTGRWLGRRHLIDHISPSKTVEGLFGGLVVATAGAGIGAALIGLAPWQPLVLGPLVGLAAQAGDLAESMLKRAAGRKESGFIIPGHGGILDRLDSFLFAAPVLAGWAVWVAGFHA
ncbi:MAG TPA: phosphatidate cytidylyltransferase [Candidatus Limnocylindria bacterium]|nr:phosphatidate cytidylyltransferase [Candidatus Limnocylindria bacterium]